MMDIDLKRYGIFKSIDEEDINESCLIQAFKYSGILTANELNMLKSFVTTRMVPQTELQHISDLLRIHNNCKILYEDTGKISHTDFGEEFERNIKLTITNALLIK